MTYITQVSNQFDTFANLLIVSWIFLNFVVVGVAVIF